MLTELEKESFKLKRQEMRLQCVEVAFRSCSMSGTLAGNAGIDSILAAAKKYFEWVITEA